MRQEQTSSQEESPSVSPPTDHQTNRRSPWHELGQQVRHIIESGKQPGSRLITEKDVEMAYMLDTSIFVPGKDTSMEEYTDFLAEYFEVSDFYHKIKAFAKEHENDTTDEETQRQLWKDFFFNLVNSGVEFDPQLKKLVEAQRADSEARAEVKTDQSEEEQAREVKRLEEADKQADLLNQAYQLAMKGSTDEALLKFEELITETLEKRPHVAIIAMMSRINLFSKMNKHESVIDESNRVLKIAPENSEALANRAYALVLMNKVSEGLADYDMAIQLDPENGVLFFNRGLVHEEVLKDFEKALADYDKAADSSKSQPGYSLWHHRALIHVRFKRFEQAVSDFTTAISKFETEHKETLEAAKKFNKNKGQLPPVNDQDGDNEAEEKPEEIDPVDALNLAAMSTKELSEVLLRKRAQRQGTDSAEKKVQMIEVSFNRTLSGIYVNRAETLTQMSRIDDALKDFQAAVKLSPINPDAALKAGLLLNIRGRYPEAIEMYSHVIELKSECEKAGGDARQIVTDDQLYTALHRRGTAYWNVSRKFDEGMNDLKRALDVKPNVQLLFQLVDAHTGRAEWDLALSCIDRILKDYGTLLPPAQLPSLYALRANCRRAGLNFPEALEDLDLAIQISPKYEHNQRRLARYYLDRGYTRSLLCQTLDSTNPSDLKSILSDYNDACYFDPTDPSYFYYRAGTYMDIGDNVNAIADLETVMSLDPDKLGKRAQVLIEKLRQNTSSSPA